ncbi:MAG TPA: hypothetical protein VNA69_01360 [Thermoanaerobaculia bacterium]|nr:hypothetical protein [Thermoanaerobaculia bacterium]
MLNIAGPEYDFANVVFVVLGECEHRRRGFENEHLEEHLLEIARAKLKKIKAAYDEFGGSAAYWQALETEVLETAVPQYIDSAQEMNRLERTGYDVFRGGDLSARLLFALAGLLLGIVLLALPFVPKFYEAAFAFLLAAGGFAYPDLKRFTHERRHFRLLNRLVDDAARYQQNSRLHYMTTTDIRESFHIAPTPEIGEESSDKQAEAE